MFIFKHPFVVYETPEVGAGGTATATTPQPTPGQGQPQNGDFWGMFPNVPTEHRALLEPHIRENVLPYVTRLEQQFAPFKPFTEANVTADDARGLLQFAIAFEQDPVGQWLRMGQQLQQEGKVHEDTDFEILAKIAAGEEIEDVIDPNDPGAAPQNGEIPPWAQQLMQQVQVVSGRLEQQDQQTVQQQQQAALDQAKTTIRTNLKEAGVPEELITDELIIGSLIANRGDAGAAEAALLNYRSGVLTNQTEQQQQNGRQPLETPNGTPPTPKRSTSRRGGSPPDGFTGVRGSAQQFLEAQLAAQGE